MGWNGSGGYGRQENFSADSSAGIKILATRMDTEFDDFASAMTLCLTRNGQNSPTANIPMAGFKLTNVGAGTSAEDYLRVKEFIKDIPIYARDSGNVNNVRVSVPFYISVSAGQSPPDGSRIKVLMGPSTGTKTSTSCTFNLFTPLNTSAGGASHNAPVWTRGHKYDAGALRANKIYEFSYDASASGWNCLNPSPSFLQTQAAVKAMSGATVAGRASSSADVTFSRLGPQLVFALQHQASVSCSISAASLLFSVTNVTSLTSGIFSQHSIPIAIKDVISHSWSIALNGSNQLAAQVTFSGQAGTTVSVACTIRAAPFTAIFLGQP